MKLQRNTGARHRQIGGVVFCWVQLGGAALTTVNREKAMGPKCLLEKFVLVGDLTCGGNGLRG